MNALLTLARPFVNILAHKAGPESLPASQFLLGLVICAHLLVHGVSILVSDDESAAHFAMALIDTVAQIVFFGGLLSLMGFQARVLQTLTAVFGADSLLHAIALPIALGLGSVQATQMAAPVLSLALIAVLLWSLAVKGHILQRAVGFPYFVGVIIALAFAIAMLFLERALFPV